MRWAAQTPQVFSERQHLLPRSWQCQYQQLSAKSVSRNCPQLKRLPSRLTFSPWFQPASWFMWIYHGLDSYLNSHQLWRINPAPKLPVEPAKTFVSILSHFSGSLPVQLPSGSHRGRSRVLPRRLATHQSQSQRILTQTKSQIKEQFPGKQSEVNIKVVISQKSIEQVEKIQCL